MNKMAYSNSVPCAKEILVVLTHGLVYGVFEYLCHNGGGTVVFVVAPAVHEMASIHGKYYKLQNASQTSKEKPPAKPNWDMNYRCHQYTMESLTTTRQQIKQSGKSIGLRHNGNNWA